MRLSMFTRSNSATMSPFFTRPPGLGRFIRINAKSPLGPEPPLLPGRPPGTLPAVDPNPEPMTLLLDADAALPDEALEVIRSENRLVEPRVAPKLDAGAVAPAAPEVSDEEEALVVVFE